MGDVVDLKLVEVGENFRFEAEKILDMKNSKKTKPVRRVQR